METKHARGGSKVLIGTLGFSTKVLLSVGAGTISQNLLIVGVKLL